MKTNILLNVVLLVLAMVAVPSTSKTLKAPQYIGTADEYTTATLSCGSGLILMNYAEYGVLNTWVDKCADKLFVTALLEKACNGKTTCSQAVNNGAFGGDPCRGNKKGLYFEYNCK